MRSSEVVITLIDRFMGKRRFVYSKPRVCTVGRAEDCDIRVPSDLEHLQISRHHCLLEIAPPTVRLRDLGSTNGTFLNGSKVRAVNSRHDADESENEASTAEVKSGDDVQLGGVMLQLHVEVLPGELQMAEA